MACSRGNLRCIRSAKRTRKPSHGLLRGLLACDLSPVFFCCLYASWQRKRLLPKYLPRLQAADGSKFTLLVTSLLSLITAISILTCKKNGFTIEAWIYITRPLEPFVWAENPAEQKLRDLWVVFEKAASYRLSILPNHRARFLLQGPGFSHTFSFPGHLLQVNQWHYLSVMFAEDYYQLVVDNKLRGSLYLNRIGLQDLNNTDGVFSVGGGACDSVQESAII